MPWRRRVRRDRALLLHGPPLHVCTAPLAAPACAPLATRRRQASCICASVPPSHTARTSGCVRVPPLSPSASVGSTTVARVSETVA
eukprot:4683580-Pleurochrysis_carterae.AAC.1